MASAHCADFLESFVLPMVAGGEMHVRAPIDLEELELFERQLPEASVPLVAIDDARERVLSELVVKPPACVFDADELHLAASVHNLLFLAHPVAEGVGVSASGRAKVIATAQRLAARPRSRNPRKVMARHGLLHQLFDIGRLDVKLSWWTGSATYYGQEPPRRLSLWPDVRRVRHTETRAGFTDLFEGSDVMTVVTTLVRRSPLSLLLTRSPHAPRLHWEDAVFVLRDPQLARAVAYESLRGKGAHEIIAAPSRFASSFEQMLERSPRQMDLRTVCAFLVHLNALLALSEIDLREKSPLLATVLSASKRPRGLSTFLALPMALELVEPRLAQPPGLHRNSVVHARFRLHRDQSLEALGDGVVEGLAERLRRHLGPMLESPPQHHGTASS